MKVPIILLSIVMLLAGLPLLHGLLAFLSIEKLAVIPTAKPIFYLFTYPAWAVSIAVFAVETYRRSFIRSRFRINNILMLALFGLIAPGAGLALSPVGADIGLPAFAGIGLLGFFVGMMGALLFNFTLRALR